jgi:hypothetical protein
MWIERSKLLGKRFRRLGEIICMLLSGLIVSRSLWRLKELMEVLFKFADLIERDSEKLAQLER